MANHTHNCCQKQKLKRGLWSPDEDEKLLACIMQNGAGSWSSVPALAGIQRCGKSCRLRWINYLRPGLKRGSFSPVEEKRIIELHEIFGNKWSKIASYLPGRTDNEIKNLWNSCLKKRIESKESQNNPQASNAANADAETKPERQKSPIKAYHMARASSPSMPSRPIFPFLHGEFVDTKKSRGNMIQASHDVVSKPRLEKLPMQGFSGSDPTDKANTSKHIFFSQQDEVMDSIAMPRQDIEQFSLSLAQLPLHSRLQSIDLMNHAVTFASDHTVQMVNYPRMSIEAMEASQDVGLLQLQTARNHGLPSESSQLNNNSTLLWNDFVDSHIAGPDSYGESPRKQVFCINTDYKAARSDGYSLKNHQQSDDSSDASFGMNYFTPDLCELGSVNQSPSTTCSDGSPTKIPPLLDYQDVEIWLSEAYHKVTDGYKIS